MKSATSITSRFTAWLSAIEWPLLVFLLVFTADMVVLKPVGLLLGLWWYRKQGLGRYLKGVPPFYWLLPVMELIRFLFFNKDFSAPHWISFSIGVAFWLMAAGAFGVLRAAVAERRARRISATLNAWFWLNCLWSVGQLVRVMMLSGALNPYRLDVAAYGNSTGDFIRGVLGGPCYLNMFVNAFFAVYFVYRRKYAASLAAVAVAVLTGSNFANIIFLLVLVLVGLLLRRRAVWLTLSGQATIFIVCYLLIFPNNFLYLQSSLKEVSGRRAKAAAEEQATLQLPAVLQPNGKFHSFEETSALLSSGPARLCFGAGMGQYSSQLAVRMSDLQQDQKSRLFRMLPHYIHPAFRKDHYRIFKTVYDLPPAYHSIRHMPGSFANQLAGEYGVAGILLFAFGYLGYLLRRYRLLTYSLPLLLLACGFLLFDYLFEYLSVMVFFELFFLADVHRQEHAKSS